MARLDEGVTRRELVALAAGLVALPALRYAGPPADPRLDALERAVRGAVIRPRSPQYESARRVFDSLYDGVRPLAIVRPLDTADVSRVVKWARTSGVHVVARSGGHSYGGYSTTSGVVVDLSRLAGVRVTAAHEAVIGPGARPGGIFDAVSRHGGGGPAGTGPSVGRCGRT